MTRYYKIDKNKLPEFLRDVSRQQAAAREFFNVAIVKEQENIVTVKIG